ncbi:MAG: hypothetical protein HQL31_14275 [Planctomycetes bacterium]|nr:hypothetical protein [Planctomycetota bacterium]
MKNTEDEKKAWSKSDEGKIMQAAFICLAHNLTPFLEDEVEQNEGVVYENDRKKRADRLSNTIRNGKIPESKISRMIKQIQRVTQRAFAFLRWLKAFFFRLSSWEEAVYSLRRSYVQFS